jgi:hypothetical protein
VQDQPLSARQHARQVVTAGEQRRRRIAALVAQQQRQWRPPPPRRRRADAGDDARARHRFADLERAQRREARAVLVPDGDEEQRITDRLQPLARQQLGALGADAFQELERRGEAAGRARLPGSGHCVTKSACLCGWELILKES